MTARHAGSGRIADTALIDQVRAAAKDIKAMIMKRPLPSTVAERDSEIEALYAWAGRAWSLLEQIGEMGE